MKFSHLLTIAFVLASVSYAIPSVLACDTCGCHAKKEVKKEGKACPADCKKPCCKNAHAHKALKAQTECPVMGGKVNKKLFADVKGKRIYVCCGGCIAEVKKHPDKYIKKLEKEGVKLEEVKKE